MQPGEMRVQEDHSNTAHLRFDPAVFVLNVAFPPALICDFLHGYSAILVFRRLGYRIEMVNSELVARAYPVW
jgi:hypothetical protein